MTSENLVMQKRVLHYQSAEDKSFNNNKIEKLPVVTKDNTLVD